MATVRQITRKDASDPSGQRRIKTGRWEALVYLGRDAESGKTRWRSQTFSREKDAREWARKLEVQRDDGTYRPSVTKLTLARYLREQWLPMYRTQVRSTYTIEKVLGKWIFLTAREMPRVPPIGGKALHKLTVGDFDTLYRAMAAENVQYRGIEYLHGILKRALKSAVRKGELPRNPADFATLPKPEVRAEINCEGDEVEAGPVQYLSKEQAARFLTVAKRDRLSALWHLLLDAGLRPGEAFALQWRHIDFERGMVKVRGTLARMRGDARETRGRGWIITKPKTSASIGDVPLSRSTMLELRSWKARQNSERLRIGAEWQDHGFVFTTEFGTPLGNNLARVWGRLLREADRDGDLGVWGEEPEKRRSGPRAQRKFVPRFSMYVLRHTCATLGLLDGVDLLQVSRRLRHKNITVTARFYGHLRAEHTTQAAESFNRLATSIS